MSKSPKALVRTFAVLFLVTTGLFVYQNCGEGFQGAGTADGSSQGDPNSTPTPSPTPVAALAGVSVLDYDTCYGTGTSTAAELSTCLNARATVPNTFTIARITTCMTNTAARANKKLALAICLSRNSMLIFNHRPPTQYDIETCIGRVGEANVAACLNKNGISFSITQATIDSCIAAVGPTRIERCLRARGMVPRKGYLFNSDVELCDMVATTPNIAACLQNMELAPSTLAQVHVDACMTATADILKVGGCLRKNFHVSKAIMQAHIAACNAAVGPTRIAACLNAQGFYDGDATVIAALQTEIDDCVGRVTVDNVAICLRNKNYLLTRLLMQPHISSCADAVTPTNAYTCITKNYAAAVLPTTFTKTALDECTAFNNGSLSTGSQCLVNAGALPNSITQAHLTACARFAGASADTTGNFPGKVGIVACLTKNGYAMAGLTQAVVDACLANVPVEQLSVCLTNRGFTIAP